MGELPACGRAHAHLCSHLLQALTRARALAALQEKAEDARERAHQEIEAQLQEAMVGAQCSVWLPARACLLACACARHCLVRLRSRTQHLPTLLVPHLGI